MIISEPTQRLQFAAFVASVVLTFAPLQSAIITGTVSENVTQTLGSSGSMGIQGFVPISLGGYFSSAYDTSGEIEGDSILFGASLLSNSLATVTVRAADSGTTGSSLPSVLGGNSLLTPTTIQHFTGSLTLGETVDASQSFNATSVSITGSETKYFGFAVTMPDSPSPLYGWLGLDGTGSTLGNELVTASWAYDTTGSSIQVGQITAVPEPATWVQLGIAALTCLSAEGFRRLRNPSS